MEHFNFNTISMIEIDVTSYCNSFCGRCARNDNGGKVIDGLPLVHLPMSAWESLIHPHNLINIKEIIFKIKFEMVILEIINLMKFFTKFLNVKKAT